MRRILQTCVGAAALAALWVGPAYADKSDNVFRYATAATLNSPDPYHNSLREALLILGQMIFDTLVYYDADDQSIKPLLAESWEWIDDKTVEFRLRHDVKFHDGSDFNADDVVYTFNWVRKPEAKVGVPPSVEWIESAEKVDDYTVRIHTNVVNPIAMDYFSSTLHVLPEDYYGPNGDEPSVGRDGAMVGTGPYRLIEFVPGVSARLEPNEAYMANSPKGTPAFSAIEYRMLPDIATQVAELMAGGLDWIWRLDRDTVETLSRNPDLETAFEDSIRIGFIRFDAIGRSGFEPLKDVRVRRAFAHAVDLEKIVPAIVGVKPIYTPCYPKQFGCVDDPEVAVRHPYDPEKARALLAEAGYADGFDVVLTDSVEIPPDLGLAIAADLAKVGIRAQIERLRFQEQYRRATEGELQADMYDYGSYGIKDVQVINSTFFTAGSSSDYINDEELSSWVKEMASTIDQDRRLELSKKVIHRVTDQVYWLPISSRPVGYAYGKDLEFTPYFDENPRLYLLNWK